MKSPNLYFIAGWSATSNIWTPLINAITYPDNCHFINWEKLIDDDAEIPTTNNNILVGWSLGGMLAIELAIKLQQTTSHLVLISSTARMIEDKDYIGTSLRSIKAMKIGLTKNRLKIITDFAINSCTEKQQKFVNNYLEHESTFTEAQLKNGLDYLAKTDLRDKLTTLNIPTTIIHAKDDNIINFQNSCFLAKNINNSKKIILDSGNHALPFSRIYEISKIISELSK